MFRKAALLLACASVFSCGCGGFNAIQISPNPAFLQPSSGGPQPIQFAASLRLPDGTFQDVTDTAEWTVADSSMIVMTNGGEAKVRQGVTVPCGFSTVVTATVVTATQGTNTGTAVLKLSC